MNRKITIIIIVVGVLFGMVGAFLLGRASVKPNDNQINVVSDGTSNQAKNISDYSQQEFDALLESYEKQIQAISKENADLRAQMYVNTSAGDMTSFDDIKKDIIYAYQLYTNDQGNFGYSNQRRYEQHTEFMEQRITENAISDFIGTKALEEIKNQSGTYTVSNLTETSFDKNTYIDIIDVTVSDIDTKNNTARFTCLYRICIEDPMLNRDPSYRWMVMYGAAKYSSEYELWQIDDIYIMQQLKYLPQNADELKEMSQDWLSYFYIDH